MKGSYPRVSAVMFMAGFAGTVTNVSVTVVTSGLARLWDEPLSRIAVAVLAMNVSMAFAMPVAGHMAGRYGLRSVLVGGGVILGISSVMLMLAQDELPLALGRLGQGVGLAAVTPTAVQASNKLLSPREHARALGWWSAANGAGLALGPVLGGALLDIGGWSLVPIPTLGIAVALVACAIVGVPAGLGHRGSVRLYGAVMMSLIAGIGVGILSAVSVGGWVVAAAAAIGLATLVAYALLSKRRAELPLSWLDDVMVRRSGAGAFVQMFVNGMTQVGVPAWLVTSAITSSGGAGVVLIAMTLTMTVMGPVTGRRADIPYATWFRGGVLLSAAGTLGLTVATAGAPWWLSIPALVVMGVGAGCLLTPSFQAFSGTVPGSDGVGLAMYNIIRLSSFAVGGIIGAAAVEAELSWASFLLATAACLFLATRTFSGASAAPAPRDAQIG